jgi:hypothetical protein
MHCTTEATGKETEKAISQLALIKLNSTPFLEKWC